MVGALQYYRIKLIKQLNTFSFTLSLKYFSPQKKKRSGAPLCKNIKGVPLEKKSIQRAKQRKYTSHAYFNS